MPAKTARNKIAPKLILAQAQLAELETRRAQVRAIKEELRAAEALASDLEAQALSLLRAGAEIQPGRLTACVEMKMGACRPSWKDLHLGHMAEHGVPAAVVEETARAAYPAKAEPRVVIGVVG